MMMMNLKVYFKKENLFRNLDNKVELERLFMVVNVLWSIYKCTKIWIDNYNNFKQVRLNTFDHSAFINFLITFSYLLYKNFIGSGSKLRRYPYSILLNFYSSYRFRHSFAVLRIKIKDKSTNISTKIKIHKNIS